MKQRNAVAKKFKRMSTRKNKTISMLNLSETKVPYADLSVIGQIIFNAPISRVRSRHRQCKTYHMRHDLSFLISQTSFSYLAFEPLRHHRRKPHRIWLFLHFWAMLNFRSMDEVYWNLYLSRGELLLFSACPLLFSNYTRSLNALAVFDFLYAMLHTSKGCPVLYCCLVPVFYIFVDWLIINIANHIPPLHAFRHFSSCLYRSFISRSV